MHRSDRRFGVWGTVALVLAALVVGPACGDDDGSGGGDGGARDGGAVDGGGSSLDAGARVDGGAGTDGGGGPACSPSGLTIEALDLAREAIRSGATMADLSADGCLRWQRRTEGGDTIDEVIAGDVVTTRWTRSEARTIAEHDDDADGNFEWQAVMTRDGEDVTLVISEDAADAGSPTHRETYTPNGAQIHVVVEELDESGALVVVREYDVDPDQPDVVTAPTPGSGTGSCTAAQAMQLKQQMEDTLSQATMCAQNIGLDKIRDHISSVVSIAGVEIVCETQPAGQCAEVDFWDSMVSLFGGTLLTGDPITVTIDPDQYFSNPACASRQQLILFHEILHTLIGAHDPEVPLDDPRTATFDRVYACSALCFDPNATKCQCARCLRTDKCDPRCAGFADCDDSGGAICRCAARPRWYDTLTECTVECPSGLACAFSSCQEVSYACR